MNIGELSKQTNVSKVAIRYYENMNLIQSIRQGNGYRHFNEEAKQRIIFIKNAQSLGFDLKEIRDFFNLELLESGSHHIKNKIQKQKHKIKEKISKLKNLEYALSELDRTCDGKMDTKDCPILQKLYLAAKN